MEGGGGEYEDTEKGDWKVTQVTDRQTDTQTHRHSHTKIYSKRRSVLEGEKVKTRRKKRLRSE